MKPSYFEIQRNAEKKVLEEAFLTISIFLMGKPSNLNALKLYSKINDQYLIKLLELNKHFIEIYKKDECDPKNSKSTDIIIELNADGLSNLRTQLLTSDIFN